MFPLSLTSLTISGYLSMEMREYIHKSLPALKNFAWLNCPLSCWDDILRVFYCDGYSPYDYPTLLWPYLESCSLTLINGEDSKYNAIASLLLVLFLNCNTIGLKLRFYSNDQNCLLKTLCYIRFVKQLDLDMQKFHISKDFLESIVNSLPELQHLSFTGNFECNVNMLSTCLSNRYPGIQFCFKNNN